MASRKSYSQHNSYMRWMLPGAETRSLCWSVSVSNTRSWVWWWSERCWTWSSPSTTWRGWMTSCLKKRRRRRMMTRRRGRGKRRRKRRRSPNLMTMRRRWETQAFSAPYRTDKPWHKCVKRTVCTVCVCVCLQDKYHGYANHSPSSESDLDRRYCVLKLHIPYKDLVYPDVTQTQWGAYCQAAATRRAL